MALPADGVGSFAQHRVIEEAVAGFGVVASGVEPVVIRVLGWDRVAAPIKQRNSAVTQFF
ncbi:MAG: hypothetical protein ACR2PK_14525 [Acidimicrobiales bacterium]